MFDGNEKGPGQAPDPMEQILRDGAVKRSKDLIESLREHGIRVDLGIKEGESLRDEIDDSLRALDEGIRQLELKEDLSVAPERSRLSVKLKRFRTTREQLESMAKIQEKLKALHGARRTR